MQIPYLSLERVTAMHAAEINNAVTETVNSGWYLLGKRVNDFEKQYATYVGARHCVACANGLDALMLTLRAYKEMGMLEDGDEVIVPANTYIATILAITENGLVPRLVEPRMPETAGGMTGEARPFQIDDSLIEEAITKRTKAVMLVHLYGFDSMTEKVARLCREHGLLLMQDCAQAHGIAVGGTCCWSFYPGKNLGALGDAGCMTTDDDQLADTVRTLANYGSAKKYVFRYEGRNSRMDEIQAAVLSVKLKYLAHDNERRREIARRFINEIKNEEIMLPVAPETLDGMSASAVWHVFPVMTNHRDRLQQYLSENGVGTVIHYPIPPHKQECYKQWASLSLPVTEKIHASVLSLPCNQTMTEEEVDYIIGLLNNWRP